MTEMKDKIYPELPTIREQPSAPFVRLVVQMIVDILTG